MAVTITHSTVATLPDEPGVYVITNAVTLKRYVGSAVSVARRWREHRSALQRGIHGNTKLQHSWKKHGADAFACRLLIRCEAKNLLLYEQLAIGAFDSVDAGYNICPTAGNALGVKHTEQSKANFRKGAAGRVMPPQSAEARLAKAVAAMGRVMPSMTPERKAAISASLKGIKRGPFSEEHRARLAAAKRGTKLSDVHRAAISRAMLGRQKPWLSSRPL